MKWWKTVIHAIHPWGLNFTCFRKKRWKNKKTKQKKTKDGLLAILKQIIGWGFVFRNKVAGMFSYSVSFIVFFCFVCFFVFFSSNYALFMDTFCTAAWKYAFPKIGVKSTPVYLKVSRSLLAFYTQNASKQSSPFQRQDLPVSLNF